VRKRHLISFDDALLDDGGGGATHAELSVDYRQKQQQQQQADRARSAIVSCHRNVVA